MMFRIFAFLGCSVFFVPTLLAQPAALGKTPTANPALKSLEYRNIGPVTGGRVTRVAGVPGDPLTYYAAAASGGVWKSTNGGLTFSPVFDDQSTQSVGSIVVAPSDPNVVYVGSGEANIRGNVIPGNGIYRSTDAGKTWQHVWKQFGQIGQIAVHPTDANIAYAAVLGHAFGPNSERGIFRTTDGGTTWKRVLHRSAHAGASDVVIDPKNPRIVWAGFWQTRRRPWELTSGGPGSGLFVSRDGGDTWDALHEEADEIGLPKGTWGKVCLAIAPSDSRRMYALIEANEGGLFRSDDGGESWDRINGDHILRQRAWYFSTITVDPLNRDVVYFPQVALLKSIDGGKTVRRLLGTHHMDHHDLWVDPKNPRRMIVATDGGVDISTNGGESWFAPPLPIAQFYHVAVDSRTPFHVMGNMQDMGTAWGPSHSLASAGIRISDWEQVGGGETGFTVPDPFDPDILYSGEYGGILTRFDRRTGQANLITAWPFNPSGFAPAELKYRYQWTAPLMASKRQRGTIYHGANVLFASQDRGMSWKVISPDLTRNDATKQRWSGGPITGDNTGVEVFNTIFALAEGVPDRDGQYALWVGSDDGLVHVSRDQGKSWKNVTAGMEDLPEWGTITCIEPSPTDPNTAYVVVDAHRLDDYHAYLWVTRDLGKSWTRLAADLPEGAYLQVIRADPKQAGLLYLGTQSGLMISRNDGRTWEPLRLNMPRVPVSDLALTEHALVVATLGRGIWILDDLTPVREWKPTLGRQPVHLFPPVPAIRWRLRDEISHLTEGYTMPNPANGAEIFYSLGHKTEKRFMLEIFDAQQKLIDRFDSTEGEEPDETLPDGPPMMEIKEALTNEPGVQRFVWNLRHRPAKVIPGAKVDAGNPAEGPLVAPGEYTVKLTVGDQTQSAVLRVLPDPRLRDMGRGTVPMPRLPDGNEPGKDAAAKPAGNAVANAAAKMFPEAGPNVPEKLSESLALRLRDGISTLTGMVKQIRSLKQQLNVHDDTLEGDDSPEVEAWRKLAKPLRAELNALEEKLHNPRAKVVYDILAQKGGAKLYSQLAYLYAFTTSADGPPAQGLLELSEQMLAELKEHTAAFAKLRDGELAKLNQLAREKGLPILRLPKIQD
ncbi:WD40/YVTN/BNR-like repeat-containing protein [Tuwongella immobilis]|uniref:Sortilin N-terminal domain-containing protein n=1 Tax=Tuwongella immobilis TaxID=692036 RepID=A0A6C2YGY7_9BACT|nr:glycosyl hydrolase [Tuwongella immobilis]VIP00677.1 Glycosyl hydrolase OS=uncultured Acidobacteria bacterium GN=HGMM_F21E04C23 PE=4 SV=1: BNR [Tuwongella immobilis]VTR96772.1 Glycosyl hydrolase OS=uncultured Acidobacteria bacterium GN=HGMM_F21E04C23 PE=4 SV=1: BNR [Tuwongella immobilis]